MTARKPATFVAFCLDETGSMDSVKDATISGFNEYVNTLKSQKGKVLFTLTKFNSHRIETVHKAVAVKDVPDIDSKGYMPAGMTPLYDAIGQVIRETEEAISGMKIKPSVLVVIMTDGEENSSKEFSRDGIFKRIKEKEAEGWTFAYMGANQDAWQVGASIGVPMGNSLNYDANQPQVAMRAMAAATSDYMTSGSRQSRTLFSNGRK